jgi:hydroxyacylglutathione hydrolase
MPLTVHQFPACPTTTASSSATRARARRLHRHAESGAILRELDDLGWELDFIFNTHWHPDHAGGNADIKAMTGCTIVGPPEVTRIAPLDREVAAGDTVELGETTLPGDRKRRPHPGPHRLLRRRPTTSPSSATPCSPWAAGGCSKAPRSRCGPACSAWPLCPTTPRSTVRTSTPASNARFALSVDDDPTLRARAAEVFAARERGEWTVPTTIGLEKATNPFLRAPALAARVGAAGEPDFKAFAAVRAAKDAFRG